MIFTIILALLIPVLAFVYFTIRLVSRKRRPGEPPIVAGNFLWGNGAEFSRNAVKFLQKCKLAYGNVFTIKLMHMRMTLLMDYRDYEAMSKERTFDFDPIQKQVNWNVFNFVLKDPRKLMKETGKWVKGKSMIGNLSTFSKNLNISFKNVIKSDVSEDKKAVNMRDTTVVDKANNDVTSKMIGGVNDDGMNKTNQRMGDNDGNIVANHFSLSKNGAQEDNAEFAHMGLRMFASNTMFAAIFNTIFGFSDNHVFNYKKVFTNFDIFHKYFNYFWLGLPKLLFPEALRALDHLMSIPEADELIERDDLSPYIKNAIAYMKDLGQTDSDIKGHNLVFLHINYNTFRISFWILYYILSNKDASKALKKEMDDLVEDKLNEEDNTIDLTVEDLDDMEMLDSIVTESFRMSSGVFMVRHITKDTHFSSHDGKVHLMRQGDKIAIYPPAIHKDKEIFQDPEEFKYDRFTKCKSDETLLQAVLPFGSLCPGRRMAILQTKLYILTTLLRFDIHLVEGEVAELDTRYYGHEILPPKKDVQIAFKPSPKPITLTMQP